MVKIPLGGRAFFYHPPYTDKELSEVLEMQRRIGLNEDGGRIIRGPRTPPAPPTPSDKKEVDAPDDGAA